jgi:hypothetical protein
MKAACLLLVVPALGALVAGCGGGSGPKTESLTVITGQTNRVTADNPPKGPSPGDLYTFVRTLFDEDNKQIGTLEGVSVTTPAKVRADGAEHRISTIQFNLPDGTITIGGVFEVGSPGGAQPGAGGVTRAILGGTGKYSNAGGEAAVTPLPNDRVKYVFSLQLPA